MAADTRSIAERLHEGHLYHPGDADIVAEQAAAAEALRTFNATSPAEMDRLVALMQSMCAEFGESSQALPPLKANFGCRFLHVGRDVFINFGLTLVDDTHIYIGDGTMLGPNVTIVAGNHPVAPALRRRGVQYNLPVHIGRNCWIGAGAIILPGITIGDASIIGAGSVVTRDIPAGVVAVSSPCRVLRTFTAEELACEDVATWEAQRR